MYPNPTFFVIVGPMADTVNEFWRMIWEQDCTSIICLTKIVEMGKVSSPLINNEVMQLFPKMHFCHL